MPVSLSTVRLNIGEKSAAECHFVVRRQIHRTNSTARGSVPAALVKALSEPRNLLITVETSSIDRNTTMIRIGNVGLARKLSQLAANCASRPPVTARAKD
jgi:hypothetical protein